ncbi:MAG TPA: SRPBCC family protein [Candidatus Tectomicrobia bacterium]|nr:SRPBCC family protein [Candidatus Tectomicrobia bacterium]
MNTSETRAQTAQQTTHATELDDGRQNVGPTERWVSAVGGGALALWGLSRRSLPGLVIAGLGGALAWRGVTGWCNVYGALGIDRAGARRTVGNVGVKIDRAITIAHPAQRLYYFWRDFRNLPRIMSHVERVEVLDETRSRWTVRPAPGATLTWEAEIVNDRPAHTIAWRTAPGSEVAHAGSVRFEPVEGGKATRLEVSLQYDPPGGVLGHAISALVGADAGRRIEQDLAELKAAVESGRVVA